MGGVTVLLTEDFRQIILLCSGGLVTVSVWSLTVNIRLYLEGDLKVEDFSNLLLLIRDGRVSEENGKINTCQPSLLHSLCLKVGTRYTVEGPQASKTV